VVDFGPGPGLGIYGFYDNARWYRIHSSSPEAMAVGELGRLP